jgi:two-component system alkaline phosphatase synthesis response regulator PhoP
VLIQYYPHINLALHGHYLNCVAACFHLLLLTGASIPQPLLREVLRKKQLICICTATLQNLVFSVVLRLMFPADQHSHSENTRNTPGKSPYKVLVVDVDPDCLEMIEKSLLKEAYEVRILLDVQQLFEVATQWKPDLLMLEMCISGHNTLEMGKQMKAHAALSDTLLLYLASQPSEASEIDAFDIGADGYVAKPLRIRALMGRVRSMLHRRDNYFGEASKLVLGNLTVEKMGQRVFIGQRVVALAQKEFELLFFLVQHPNQIFNREELIREVWGSKVVVLDRTIDVHIHKLREKLGDDYISTVKGMGYLLNAKPS